MVKIKVPKMFKAGGVYPYKIVYNSHLRDDEGYIGAVNFRKEVIEILPQLAPRRKDEDLLHELIHIFEDIYHFQIDEQTNHRIAEGFLDFLVNALGIELDWSDFEEN